MLTTENVAMVLACFLLGGFIKGAIGMGLPVIVLAGLALLMPLRDAMAIFLIPGIASNLWQATSGPWLGPLVRRLWPFLGAAFVTIWIGVGIVAATKSDMMVLILAAILCAYSVWSLLTPRLPPPGRHEVWMSPAAGALGGIMFGLTGVFIVPGLLYVEALGMKRDMFVQALGLTFITISGTLALSMTTVGLVTRDHAILSVIGLVPTGIGLWAGRRIRHHISEERYRKAFFVTLFITGIYTAVRAWPEGGLF